MSSAEEPSPASPPPPKRRKWRRRLTWLAATIALLLIAGELTARFVFQLGNPPLLMSDPEIEYLFKPDQDCQRFGNHTHYNHFSMRSPDFPAHKSTPAELRIMCVGDSVINGGNPTDQSELATTLLQSRLASELKRPVVVGNISAGSWGPPNELAFLKRFGLFDADVLVIVISTHDAWDVPTFAPIPGAGSDGSQHKPISALWEGFARYLLPRIRGGSPEAPPMPDREPPTDAPDVVQCMNDLRKMIQMGHQAGAAVIVAQHMAPSEIRYGTSPCYKLIADVAKAEGAQVIELGPLFADSLKRGQDPYRPNDVIHPNALGQRLISDGLTPVIERAVADREKPCK